MKNKGDKFRQKAVDIIEKFARETGECSYRRLSLTTSYDTGSGEVTRPREPASVFIAFGAIGDNHTAQQKEKSSSETVGTKGYIAGLSIDFVPMKGDEIETASGVTYCVGDEIVTDMYGALYTLELIGV